MTSTALSYDVMCLNVTSPLNFCHAWQSSGETYCVSRCRVEKTHALTGYSISMLNVVELTHGV